VMIEFLSGLYTHAAPTPVRSSVYGALNLAER
jgi:hypothetical protein